MFYFLALCVIFQACYGFQSYNSKSKVLVDSRDSENVNMIVMGDWGGIPVFPYYTPFEKTTAARIIKYANENQTDFVLALGDNFYFTGVKDEFDSRFQYTFENVFSDPKFSSIPWYVLAGNHDHYGNVTGQIAYSMHSKRWNFPNLWYAIDVIRPEFNITIVMIDTVTLCGNTVGDDHSSAPDGLINEVAVFDQLEFIENKLKYNTNEYLLVAGHFPVWSVAEHGPTQCLVNKLKPLLEKYKVNAYLCGHDHNLQHIREPTSKVEYFVSGAVNVVDPSTEHEQSIPDNSLQFYWGNIFGLGGFATIVADKTSMKLEFHSGLGSNLYQYEIFPRK